MKLVSLSMTNLVLAKLTQKAFEASVSLQDLPIRADYRSSDCDIVQDFYIPCLEQATAYDRAVGYFSSSSMICITQGLTAFIRSGGRMRLVTSPQLSREDIEAIAQGLQQRHTVIENALLRELEQELPQVIQDRLGQGKRILQYFRNKDRF